MNLNLMTKKNYVIQIFIQDISTGHLNFCYYRKKPVPTKKTKRVMIRELFISATLTPVNYFFQEVNKMCFLIKSIRKIILINKRRQLHQCLKGQGHEF